MNEWVTRQTIFKCSRCKTTHVTTDGSQPEGWFAYQAVTPPLASFENSPRLIVCPKCAHRFSTFMSRKRPATHMPRVERTALDPPLPED